MSIQFFLNIFFKNLLTNTPRGYIISTENNGGDTNGAQRLLPVRALPENQGALPGRIPLADEPSETDTGSASRIENMLENNAYCTDIMVQTAAVTAALNSFNKQVLASHMKSCVAQNIREGNDKVIDELLDTLQKMMK